MGHWALGIVYAAQKISRIWHCAHYTHYTMTIINLLKNNYFFFASFSEYNAGEFFSATKLV